MKACIFQLSLLPMSLPLQKEKLIELAHAKMYFGKYKDWYLSDIPEPYYVWFRQKGFPKGKLGEQMQAVYELKINGLEQLLKNIRQAKPYSS